MERGLGGLLAVALLGACALLGSCAAHNSHRIDIDLAGELDPLIDQAFTELTARWPEDPRLSRIATRVEIQPVPLRWWPRSDDPTQPRLVFTKEAMAKHIEDRLRQVIGVPPDPTGAAEYVVKMQLLADLHDPQTIAYAFDCDLARAEAPGVNLARGQSGIVRLPRLYCHGCRDTLGDLGAHLHDSVADYDGGAEYGVGVGIGIYTPSCSSPGYTKVR